MDPGLVPDNPPPELPRMPRRAVVALVEYAKAYGAWSQDHVDQATLHGLAPHPQEYKNVEGWAFVAMALAEAYDLEEYFQ